MFRPGMGTWLLRSAGGMVGWLRLDARADRFHQRNPVLSGKPRLRPRRRISAVKWI
jgi:hypothetical protein